MRRVSSLAWVALAAACADAPDRITGPDDVSPSLARNASSAQAELVQPGVVVARFADPSRASSVAADHGAAPLRSLRLGMSVLRVPEGTERQIAAALARDPRVVFAEPSVPRTLGLPCSVGDCRQPTDGHFGRRWDLHNDGAVRDATGNVLWTNGLVPDADMDWLEAFDQLGAFQGSAVVGVIDTGIFGSHVDLAGRLIAQHDHFNVDDVAEDDNGHGTHVSGIALAHADNGVGAAGIAYGPDVRLVVSKGCGLVVFIGYICWSPDIADGIAWAVDNGANVINLSLGGNQGSAAEQTALQYALAHDVLPICAAGNDQSDVDYPAAFPECMAVSSTTWSDQLASYSSWGPDVEVSAPGGDTIHASGYDMIASTYNNGGYVYLAGTSMAAPQVTGLAALLHALGVTSADAKRQIIRSSADDLGPAGFDPLYGHGRVNVWNAVLSALGSPPPPPTPNEPPVAAFASSCTDNACAFTDQSTDVDGSVVAWNWYFGDGTASDLQNPSHAYAAAGTYTVALVARDNRGAADTAMQAVTVTGPPPPPPNQAPVAAFTYACTYLTCAFTDGSTDPEGRLVAWSWSFGDGSTTNAPSPTRTYGAPGDYTVTLTVRDHGGLADTTQQVVTATAPPPPPPNQPPVAAFTYACTDLTCAFTDASTDSDGSIVARDWDFGDGSTTNATNPSHIYASGGDYTVALTVRDNGGLTHTIQQLVSLVAPPPPPPPPPNEAPTAAFTYSCSDLTCTFTESSTDSDGTVVAWVWDMGDGTGTNARNPTYIYEFAGTYTVELRVTDDGGLVGTTQQTITVTAPPSASIVLSANGYRRSGRHVVDLKWTGTSVPVDVYRNDVVLATVPSTPPSYRDYTRQAGKATYVYRVCESGTAICSNEVTVEF